MNAQQISEYLDQYDPEDLGAMLFEIRDQTIFPDDDILRVMVDETGLGKGGFLLGLLALSLHIGCKLAER